jgi:RNA polymerase sigma-70 factor (TIGR02943 family)
MALETPYKLEPEKWVERYADALYSFALARVSRTEVAEDLVQETFLSAYKAKDSFLANASEKTWLISILKRKVIDYYRKKSTQNELNVLDNDYKSGTTHFFGNDDNNGHWTYNAAPKTWGKDFETTVESKEFQGILQSCLGKLQPKLAAVFTLKNMDDLDSEEICKELGISPSNYWVMMHRAKLQLRECLEKNWYGK